jgi:hypothetical protein
MVDQKAGELAGRPPAEAWAALASLWARLFVLAGSGWSRWPALRASVEAGFVGALERARSGARSSAPALLGPLEAFSVEDDGTAEWQYAIDLVAMLADALRGTELDQCVRNALTWYLEGTFNILANELSDVRGRPVSQTEASAHVGQNDRWHRAVQRIASL